MGGSNFILADKLCGDHMALHDSDVRCVKMLSDAVEHRAKFFCAGNATSAFEGVKILGKNETVRKQEKIPFHETFSRPHKKVLGD